MSAVIEFDVQFKCQSCKNNLEDILKSTKGITNYNILFDKGSVIVETELPSSVVLDKIESTGQKAVLKGYSSAQAFEKQRDNFKPLSAVAMLGGPSGFSCNPSLLGIVRFVQISSKTCVVDGVVDGLSPGNHGLHVHECGDLSKGCESVGEHYNLSNCNHGGPGDEPNNRHTGDLGNVTADLNGRATFRFEDNCIDVSNIIGRSLVITEKADDFGKCNNERSKIDGNSGSRLACGIIARSAGLLENEKKICACDGVTLWDERKLPLAGPSRRV